MDCKEILELGSTRKALVSLMGHIPRHSAVGSQRSAVMFTLSSPLLMKMKGKEACVSLSTQNKLSEKVPKKLKPFVASEKNKEL